MKKITWLLAILLSLPAGAILARDAGSGGGGGDRGGGGGGWSGGGDSGGGGDRGGGGNGGDNSAGSNAGSGDFSDHSSNNNNHAYSNSARSNGGSLRSGGNAYYRNGRNGSAGYGQVRHYNHSFGSHGSNGYNVHSNSTGLHHFNSSTGGFSGHHSYASGSPTALGRSSLLPHSLQHSSVKLPTEGPSGKAFSASVVSPNRMNSSMVRNQMSSIAHNSAFTARMASFNHSDTLGNHYYWHSWGGGNYCHYRDGWGCNWYGWGWGGSFFWTQYYGDNWWWYDPWNARWCYWWGDSWYWQDPSNTTVYVYDNGSYAPGDEADVNAGGNSYNQAPSGNGEGSPSGENQSGNMAESTNSNDNPNVPNDMVEFPSQDKTRTVKIVGESGDAFLYDTAKNSFKPLFLESDVKNVQFSKNSKGALKIKLILSDGSYEIFDAQGKQLKETDAPKTGQSVDVEGDNT
jgi:hypothetical protein